ncbi:MAG: hypothetical protein AAF939_22265 [Planctomycetota bacterium]
MATYEEVHQILEEIVEAKAITAEQVGSLENFVRKDWVIDENEGKLLFRVNHSLGGDPEEDQAPEWTKFFVTSISRLVVMDMNTPGEIDQAEGDWLGSMFDSYSVGNATEAALLKDIKQSTTSVHGKISQRIH